VVGVGGIVVTIIGVVVGAGDDVGMVVDGVAVVVGADGVLDGVDVGGAEVTGP